MTIRSRSRLATAIIHGNVEIMRDLLRRGADPNEVEDNGLTPLMMAARISESHAIIQELLMQGASLHTRSAEGATPLHYAVRAGNTDAVNLLLAAGADLNAPGPNGETSLTIAVRNKQNVTLVHKLLAAGANVNGRIAGGVTPLMIAVQSRNEQAVAALLANGADSRAQTPDGLAAIDLAKWRQVELHLPFWRLYWSVSIPEFRRNIRRRLLAAAQSAT